MSDATLHELFDLAWTRILRGVCDKRSPARHPALATVSPDGLPEVRTVVLRGADRAAARLEVHTDTASSKVAGLGKTPWAELHVWDAGQRLQLRLAARVEVVTGDAVADRWARIPDGARSSYGGTLPGEPITGPHDTGAPGDPARFAALICQVHRIDLLRLGTVHQRAEYRAGDGWAGRWIAP